MPTRTSTFEKSPDTLRLEGELASAKQNLQEQRHRDRRRASRRPALYREAFAYLMKEAALQDASGDSTSMNYLQAAVEAVAGKVDSAADRRAMAARRARHARVRATAQEVGSHQAQGEHRRG